MSKKQDVYEVRPFPRVRQLVIDSTRLGKRKHTIHGLIEIDVTEARRTLREYNPRTGESLSFTAFIITCLGKAVEMDKSVHAYRNWRNQLILFDEVDVNTIIETDMDGHKFPLAHVIRAANRRTVQDIHNEIRAVQANPQKDIGSKSRKRYISLFLMLPGFMRQLFYRIVYRNPHWLKKGIGTVNVTAVGMFGEGGGWGIPISIYNLALTLGGIAMKPGVVNGRIYIREYLSVTVSFDHDIIDGAPAARFTQRFKELVESNYGLVEQNAE